MSVGKVGPFDVENDNWELYVDRLEQYFVANDVNAALKVATLITVVGSEGYELMVNLCTPVKPADKTYPELVAVMKKHLQPKPSILAERFKFRQRIQAQTEKVREFMAELKKLSKNCNFPAEGLKDCIRDQFVCGLLNDNIRQRLFAEEDLTLETAFKMAMTMEAAETDAALVEGVNRCGDTRAMPVHRVAAKGAQGGRAYRQTASADYGSRGSMGGGTQATAKIQGNADCRVCGGHHNASLCKFKSYVCRVCNKKGHLKKVCPILKGGVASVHNFLEVQQEEHSVTDSSDE